MCINIDNLKINAEWKKAGCRSNYKIISMNYKTHKILYVVDGEYKNIHKYQNMDK